MNGDTVGMGSGASCRPSTSRSPTTTAATSSSGPTATCTSGWVTAGRAATRWQRSEHRRAAGQDPAHRPHAARRGQAVRDPAREPLRRRAGRRPRDLGVRAAQPLAVHVRPSQRRPVDRRRGPEPVGGDRPAARSIGRRGRRQPRLGPDGGHPQLRGRHQPRRRGPAHLRVRPRPGLLGERRRRVHGHGSPRADRRLPVHRLLQRDHPGGPGPGRGADRAAGVRGPGRQPGRVRRGQRAQRLRDVARRHHLPHRPAA